MLLVGDRLLQINDVTLVGCTHKQAVEALRSAPVTSRLVLVRGVKPTPQQQQQRPLSPTDSPTMSPTPMTTPSIVDSRMLSPSIKSDTYATTDTDMKDDETLVDGTDTPVVPADDADGLYSFVNTGRCW